MTRPALFSRAALNLLMVLLLLVLLTGKAEALMLKMSLEELTDGADVILKGSVEEINSQWNKDRSAIYTVVTVNVGEKIKGQGRSGVVDVVVPGGEVDGIVQRTSDTPAFYKGEKVVLFLEEMPVKQGPRIEQRGVRVTEPVFSVYGDFQGKHKVKDNRVGNVPVEVFKKQIDEIQANGEAKNTYIRLEEEQADLNGNDFVYNGQKWFGDWPEVEYKVNTRDAPAGSIEAVRNAGEAWNGAGACFSYHYGGTHTRSGDASYNGVNEVNWFNMGSSSVLARATWWYYPSTGQIVEADIVFNTHYSWSNATPTPSGRFDVETVALHEMGHWLSLCHSDVLESVMYYQYKGMQRYLHEVDVEGIRYIYGSNTCNISSPGQPTGPEKGYVDKVYEYEVSEAVCSPDHDVEYRFDWGDGSYSNWGPSTSNNNAWQSADSYEVRAQARCTVSGIVSNWSRPLAVKIEDDDSGFYTSILYWQANEDGTFSYWEMDGFNAIGTGYLTWRGGEPHQAPDWRIAAVHDIDGDGSPEIIWQANEDGTFAYWKMDGFNATGAGYLTWRDGGPHRAPGWEIADIYDLNGDGSPEVIWQSNGDGKLNYWKMDGFNAVKAGFITCESGEPLVAGNMQIAVIRDLIGDGSPEIVWQSNSEGHYPYWVMDGFSKVDSGYLTYNGAKTQNVSGWQIVGCFD